MDYKNVRDNNNIGDSKEKRDYNDIIDSNDIENGKECDIEEKYDERGNIKTCINDGNEYKGKVDINSRMLELMRIFDKNIKIEKNQKIKNESVNYDKKKGVKEKDMIIDNLNNCKNEKKNKIINSDKINTNSDRKNNTNSKKINTDSDINNTNNTINKNTNHIYKMYNHYKLAYSQFSNTQLTHTVLQRCTTDEFLTFILDTYCEYSTDEKTSIRTYRGVFKHLWNGRYQPVGVIVPDSAGTCVLDARSSAKFARFVDQVNDEGLALIILGNFRGFSGGDVDMRDGVLLHGASIVRALNSFRNRIVVYVSSTWQLRGGTFVIVDRNINRKIRIACGSAARVGILQPDGLSEIKFKLHEQKNLLRKCGIRTDEKTCAALSAAFCDLHDRPERLVLRDVIDGIVDEGVELWMSDCLLANLE